MLEFYLTTVLIWMIILNSIIVITKDLIIKNGWTDETQPKKKKRIKGIMYSFFICAIPIFRFFVVIMFVIMSAKTKEEVNAWKEENNSK